MSRVTYKPLTIDTIAHITGAAAVDILGELNDAIKKMKQDIGSMKEILKSENPDGGEILGRTYRVTVTNSSRTTLDTASVRKEMGDDWYTLHSATSEIQTIRSFKIKD